MPIAAVRTSLPTSSNSAQRSSNSAQSCPTQTVLENINNTTRSDGAIQGENNDGETQKVGLAVGFGVGVPLLIALSAAIFLLWREKRSHQLLRQQLSGGLVQPVNPVVRYGWGKPYEMCPREQQRIEEMPTGSETIPELYEDRLGR